MRWKCAWFFLFSLSVSMLAAEEPSGELAQRLATVEVTQYAEAPGYSEGPLWRDGELFFCSGELLRVDKDRKVSRYLDLHPAGTFLCANGDILVADNKYRSLLNVAVDGTVGVVAEKFGDQPLTSLNDLTADSKGNIYWTDPVGSSAEKPVGNIFRVAQSGQVDKVASGLAFPNGLDVDPSGQHLYVVESQTAKILRYALPADDQPLAPPTTFHELGGSGGDGCAFDATGNLWVADFHRKETGKGRITVLSTEGKAIGHLNIPAKVVSNITFGGHENDEVFCTTGEPPGVFHAKVKVKGFKGHPVKAGKILRKLELK